MKLYVVRHGKTALNDANRVCGSTDIPLTEEGFSQARETAEKLAEILPADTKVYASPMIRARQTAEIICKRLSLDFVTDERLREQDYGIFEKELRSDPAFLEAKRNLAADFPQGESTFRLAARVYGFLDELKKREKNSSVLIVAHGAVCRVIRSCFVSMNNEEFVNYSPENCSVAEYEA